MRKEKKKRIPHYVKRRPLHHISLTSLLLVWMACWWCSSLLSSPFPLMFSVIPQTEHSLAFSLIVPLCLQLIIHIDSCHLLSCWVRTESHLTSSDYLVLFHRVFSMALCMHTFRSCPLSFHLDNEKKKQKTLHITFPLRLSQSRHRSW